MDTESLVALLVYNSCFINRHYDQKNHVGAPLVGALNPGIHKGCPYEFIVTKKEWKNKEMEMAVLCGFEKIDFDCDFE